MPDKLLEVKHLKKYFNTKNGLLHAVDDVSFDIERGETLGLVGESGCGKSTIGRAILRLHEPTSGEVLLNGVDVTKLNKQELRALRQKMQIVFQDPYSSLDGRKSVFESIGEPLVIQKVCKSKKEYEERVYELMETVGLAERLVNAYPHELDGGRRQRVGIARALALNPEFLVLDEPTSFLDVRYKLELLSILRNMAKKKGITVIMSLHEIDLAEKVADKIICVKGDRIAHCGKPETIFQEETIRELYGIDNGYFDPVFGSLELPRPEGEPKVFVISSGGSGIPVYRRLQRKNIPFAAGVLYPNDIDYQLARLLAVQTVTEKPFEKISDQTFEEAVKLMDSCESVINAGIIIGSANHRIVELLEKARQDGKLKSF